MTAWEKNRKLVDRLARAGITATMEQADTLRRAELALQRWSELECGDGNDHASWHVMRDETTGKPFWVHQPHRGAESRRPYPDKEAGALARIKAVCAEIGCHYFHQGDPRGCALYVSAEPLTDSNYSGRGVACCV